MKEKTIFGIKNIVFQIAGWLLLLVATILFFFILMEYTYCPDYPRGRNCSNLFSFIELILPFILSLSLGIYYLWVGSRKFATLTKN